jgi:dipeptidyl aminopeptidase/acylaminoacyl peptidase
MVRIALVLVFLCAIVTAAPAQATPPVEDYGRLPALDMVTLSPSGLSYAFVVETKGLRSLYVVAVDTGRKIQSVALGQAKIIDLYWISDDYLLIEKSATISVPGYIDPKAEISADFVVNIKTGKVINVFGPSYTSFEHFVDGYYGSAQIDGRLFGYFGGYGFAQGSLSLYRIDLETGIAQLALAGEPTIAGWVLGPQGRVVARSFYDQRDGHWELRAGNFAGSVLASGAQLTTIPRLRGLGRTADTVLLAHDDGAGTVIDEIPLAGGAAKRALDEDSNVSLIKDRRSKLWIGSFWDADTPGIELFASELAARASAAIKPFAGYRARLVSWSDDFKRVVVFTDGGDDSGSYWFVNLDKKSADPIGYAYPTVHPDDVGPVKMVDWKASDGLALRGVLTLPPGKAPKNLPVVVMPHGGPWARDYPGFDYWAQAFASRGYAVFQPNFRASTGYGYALYKAGFGQVGRKMQTDVSDGVAELARQGVIDPKRACIVGWSYGGYAALAGVTLQQGLYKCSVSMAGVSDFEKFLWQLGEDEGKTSAAIRDWSLFLGVTSNNWSVLNTISPIKFASRADAPILLIHGKDDSVVAIAQSDAMQRALTAAGKPVERLTLEGGDHWLLREDTRIAMLKASVAFVQKYDPAD